MSGIRPDRVKAFCDWVQTLPLYTKITSYPEFRGFHDLSDDELDAAAAELRQRAGAAHAEAGRLARLKLERAPATSTVVPFPGRRPANDPAPVDEDMDLDALAAQLGSNRDWRNSAILHLKVATSNRNEGMVSVPVAALHLVLHHVEQMEAQLGLIGPGAA